MIKQQLQAILSQTRQGLEQIYGPRLDKIILYGSQARGDAEKDSDIDILIVFKEPFNYFEESEKISYLIADLCLENTVLISCMFATTQKYQDDGSGLFRNIRREGVVIETYICKNYSKKDGTVRFLTEIYLAEVMVQN